MSSYELEKREDKRQCQRITFVVLIVLVVLTAGGLAIATLVVNQNQGSLQRIAIEARGADTGSASVGVARGVVSLQTAEERVDFRLQHRQLSSAVTSVWIKGPVTPGALHSSTRALVLCGPPCGVACDVSVANQVSGTLIGQTCDSHVSLMPVIKALREQPTRFYLQVNTGNFPGTSDEGELRDYLTKLIGSPV